MAVAVMVVVGLSATLNDSMVFGLGTPAQVLLLVTYLVPLLVLVQLVIVARLYGSDVGRGIKFFHSLLVLIGLYLSWLLYYWNFYGPYPWRYRKGGVTVDKTMKKYTDNRLNIRLRQYQENK